MKERKRCSFLFLEVLFLFTVVFFIDKSVCVFTFSEPLTSYPPSPYSFESKFSIYATLDTSSPSTTSCTFMYYPVGGGFGMEGDFESDTSPFFCTISPPPYENLYYSCNNITVSTPVFYFTFTVYESVRSPTWQFLLTCSNHTLNISTSTTIQLNQPALSLTGYQSPSPVAPGGTFTVVLYAKNTGTDPFPSTVDCGLNIYTSSYVQYQGSIGTCQASAGSIQGSVSVICPGQYQLFPGSSQETAVIFQLDDNVQQNDNVTLWLGCRDNWFLFNALLPLPISITF